jgi:hypothetical protein
LLLDGIKAIGPAANLQLFEPAAERQLRLVAADVSRRFCTTAWPSMPSSALGAGVKRRSRSPRAP